MAKRFVVVYERDARSGAWTATIERPREASCAAQGPSLVAVRKRIRQQLALQLKLTAEAAARAELVDDIRLNAAARRAVDRARHAREQARIAGERSSKATAATAQKLIETGLGVRDAAEVLDEPQWLVHNTVSRQTPRVPVRSDSPAQRAGRAAFMAMLRTRPKTREIPGIADLIRKDREAR